MGSQARLGNFSKNTGMLQNINRNNDVTIYYLWNYIMIQCGNDIFFLHKIAVFSVNSKLKILDTDVEVRYVADFSGFGSGH